MKEKPTVRLLTYAEIVRLHITTFRDIQLQMVGKTGNSRGEVTVGVSE